MKTPKRRRLDPAGLIESISFTKLVIGGVVLVSLVLGGLFAFKSTDLLNWQVDPKTANSVAASFRNMPSKIDGQTVDEAASDLLSQSRRAGALFRYQGWITRPISGTKSRFKIVFAYQEKDNVVKTAEWVADIRTKSFVPQNDLASQIYGR